MAIALLLAKFIHFSSKYLTSTDCHFRFEISLSVLNHVKAGPADGNRQLSFRHSHVDHAVMRTT
jgi:hypothetical protein